MQLIVLDHPKIWTDLAHISMKIHNNEGGSVFWFAHGCRYHSGVELFNCGRFFEAHEVLEDLWRVAIDPERKYLQGLVQVAVALHHHSRGNLIGCRSLLARAERNLRPYLPEYGGINVATLLNCLADWRAAFEY